MNFQAFELIWSSATERKPMEKTKGLRPFIYPNTFVITFSHLKKKVRLMVFLYDQVICMTGETDLNKNTSRYR